MLAFCKLNSSKFIYIIGIVIIVVFCDNSTNAIVESLNKDDCRCFTDNNEAVCLTPACIHSASTLINNMNESADPCEDFYNFACGGFMKETVIPENSPTVSPFSILQEKVFIQLRTILNEPSASTEPRTIRLLKKFYSMCMNSSSVDKTEVSTMNEILKNLGGWPVLENSNWNENEFDWIKLIQRFRKFGIATDSIVNIYPGVNTYNSSQNIMNCDQATLGLDREHLAKSFNDKFVQYYYTYLVDLAVMLGANKTIALKDIEESVKFETQLAKITLTLENRRNVSTLTNIMTVAELQNKFPVIPWMDYLENVIDDPNITITENEEVDIGVPQFLMDLDTLLRNTSKRILANYLMSQLVMNSVLYLQTDMRVRRLEYLKYFQGNIKMDPRWKECTVQASKSLSIAAGSLYVRHYFDDASKNQAKTLVEYLRAQFLHILENVKWMDSTTKKRAINKALKMRANVGYPIEYLSDNKIDEYYQDLEPDDDSYLMFKLNINKFLTDKSFKALRKFVKQSDWVKQSAVTTVNAYYSFTANSIELPAGILQGLFFDRNRPNYLNFGSIGFAIGHEVTHGFDDMGRQYDENSNLANWWEQTTATEFLENAQCIIDQFSNYTSPQVNMKINGINTQGENIADNGGVNEAYLAYKTWVKHNGVEPKLPGVPYNQEQLFWISLANTWCVKERKEYVIQQILTDNHPPNDVRLLGLISNSEQFSKDFNCKTNRRMNPLHKCKVWS